MPEKLTQEEFEKRVNDINPNIDLDKFAYVNTMTKGHCRCKLCGYEWDAIPLTLMRGNGCRKCFDNRNSQSRKKPIEEIQSELNAINPNIKIIGDYIDTKHEARLKCEVCGHEWYKKIRSVLRGSGCPVCLKQKRAVWKTSEEFIKHCSDVYDGKYIYVDLPENIAKDDEIKFVCQKHGLITQKAKKHFDGHGCILCSKRQLENKVSDILNECGIKFVENYKLTNSNFETDFFIPCLNVAINILGLEFFDEKEIFGGEEWKIIRFQNITNKESFYKENDILSVYFTLTDSEPIENLKYAHTKKGLLKYIKQKEGKELRQYKKKYNSDSERNISLHNRFAKTTSRFITEAEKVHKGKYIYSKVDYKRNSEKICIICPKHGEFWQTPKTHLKGHGCKLCAAEESSKRLSDTQDEFLKKLHNKWGDEYDTNDVLYKNNHTKITLVCHKVDRSGKEHGAFNTLPANLLNGYGCPKCGIDKQTQKQTITFTDFQKRAKAKHGDKYSYTEENYRNTSTKIGINCRYHGKFWMTPHSHLAGQGCPLCGRVESAKKRSLNTEIFIERSTSIHDGKYNYDDAVYVRGNIPVKIKCPIHGYFMQKPMNHLSGQGCPHCRESKLEREVRKFIEEHTDLTYETGKRFPWLGSQHLDFYFPDLNIAIECQGAQHFDKDFYNRNYKDKECMNYNKIVERDERKRRLCEENNVQLIYYFNSFFNDRYQFSNPFFNNLNELFEYISKMK